eukprot:COSAG05_NODE_103_length_19033_cov_99.004278_17_plen_93_part_00
MSLWKYALAIFKALVTAVVAVGSASAPPANIFQTAVPCGTVEAAMLVVGVSCVGRRTSTGKIYPARTQVALLWVVASGHHPRLAAGGSQWSS